MWIYIHKQSKLMCIYTSEPAPFVFSLIRHYASIPINFDDGRLSTCSTFLSFFHCIFNFSVVQSKTPVLILITCYVNLNVSNIFKLFSLKFTRMKSFILKLYNIRIMRWILFSEHCENNSCFVTKLYISIINQGHLCSGWSDCSLTRRWWVWLPSGVKT